MQRRFITDDIWNYEISIRRAKKNLLKIKRYQLIVKESKIILLILCLLCKGNIGTYINFAKMKNKILKFIDKKKSYSNFASELRILFERADDEGLSSGAWLLWALATAS